MTVTRPNAKQPRSHLLLTVLGRGSDEADYVLEGQYALAALAPVALLELLPEADKPDHVLAICTDDAMRDTWPTLNDALIGRCSAEAIEVEDGTDQASIDSFLATVTNAVPHGVELTVDVTHGLRHFSFLTYVAVLYLAELQDVRVRGAYYGLYRKNDTSPFLNLAPLLQLPRFVHALQVLRETGSAEPLAVEIEEKQSGQAAAHIARELSLTSEAFLSGLPLELGHHVGSLYQQHIKPLTRLLKRTHRLPLTDNLVAKLKSALEDFRLDGTQVSGWKAQLPLNEPELFRQAKVIDALLDYGNVATALGLMNEWTVSWVVLRRYGTDDWLDYRKVRRKAAGLLGATTAVVADRSLKHMLTEDQRSLGLFWRDLTELRNGFHHHGMRSEVLTGGRKSSSLRKTVEDYWRCTLRSCPSFALGLGSSRGRVLVSPVGMRPGVLFSALHACRQRGGDPRTCVVLCSEDTQGTIEEAVRQAGYHGELKTMLFQDPFSGRTEIRRIEKRTRDLFVGADAVFVNVTGGTTLMGLAAEALGNAARQLAAPVHRFGLIDRRSAADQEAYPYQVGEPFWLDVPEDGDGSLD